MIHVWPLLLGSNMNLFLNWINVKLSNLWKQVPCWTVWTKCWASKTLCICHYKIHVKVKVKVFQFFNRGYDFIFCLVNNVFFTLPSINNGSLQNYKSDTLVWTLTVGFRMTFFYPASRSYTECTNASWGTFELALIFLLSFHCRSCHSGCWTFHLS